MVCNVHHCAETSQLFAKDLLIDEVICDEENQNPAMFVSYEHGLIPSTSRMIELFVLGVARPIAALFDGFIAASCILRFDDCAGSGFCAFTKKANVPKNKVSRLVDKCDGSKNRLPSSGTELAPIMPPISSVSSREINKPNPEPPYCR